METSPESRAARIVASIERAGDALVGARANPLRQLGAIGFDLFWLVIATGTYLYAWFDTSVGGAYLSVQNMTGGWAPFSFSGLVRSLHRYGSDALVIVIGLHLLREAALGRFRFFRRFSWLSGLPTIVLIAAAGIGGYALVWDAVAQWIGVGTAEWFAVLPGFADDMVRNFTSPEAMTDRFFSLLVFLHIGVSLLLLAAMWVHIQRLSHARTGADNGLRVMLLLGFLGLASVFPAQSHAPADARTQPLELAIDWFYLAVYPMLDALGPRTLWGVVAVAGIALVLMAWTRGRTPLRAALVNLADCNGCARCFADCPYAAITMVPRRDGRSFRTQPEIDAARCAACGICAGACPSATPFRSIAKLASGVDLPDLPIDSLRRSLESGLAQRPVQQRETIVVFACRHAVAPEATNGFLQIMLECAAQLPPSFIEYALRHGADGVVIAGCRDGACQYRLGMDWLRERLARQRPPELRTNVPAERWIIVPTYRGAATELTAAIHAFQTQIAALPSIAASRSARASRELIDDSGD